jgi:hypothetical protein
MPRPLGRDRIAGVREGKLLLSCAEPKGWRVRVPKAATSAEHPGTCVRWEEQLFEVEDLETHADGSLTYTLARWDERHAIRVIVTYDAETEAQRIKETRTATRRVEGRTALLLAAPFVGCLPAPVQERFEHEYNVRASTMSLASALPLWILGWISLILLLASSVGGAGFLPTPVLVFGVYLLAESTARLAVCIQQGRPIGTFLGTLLYEVWRISRRGLDRSAERAVPPEKSLFQVEPPEPWEEDVDRFHLLEPVLSFLEARDQDVLAKRFGFDGLRWARISAIFLLVALGPFAATALLGFLLVPEVSDLLVLLLAGGLCVEQVLRLRRVARKRPAPSVLGLFIRPWARRLLAERTPE